MCVCVCVCVCVFMYIMYLISILHFSTFNMPLHIVQPQPKDCSYTIAILLLEVVQKSEVVLEQGVEENIWA